MTKPRQIRVVSAFDHENDRPWAPVYIGGRIQVTEEPKLVDIDELPDELPLEVFANMDQNRAVDVEYLGGADVEAQGPDVTIANAELLAAKENHKKATETKTELDDVLTQARTDLDSVEASFGLGNGEWAAVEASRAQLDQARLRASATNDAFDKATQALEQADTNLSLALADALDVLANQPEENTPAAKSIKGVIALLKKLDDATTKLVGTLADASDADWALAVVNSKVGRMASFDFKHHAPLEAAGRLIPNDVPALLRQILMTLIEQKL